MHHHLYILIFVLALGKVLAYEDVLSNEEIRAWRFVFTRQKDNHDTDGVVKEKERERESPSSEEPDSYKTDSSSNELTTVLRGPVFYSCKNPNDVALTFDDGIRYIHNRRPS
jgi:hypothetical protein